MTSSDPSNRPTTGTGASPLGEDQRKRRPIWLWIVAAIVLIVVIILLLSRCGGDDNPVSDAANSATSAAASVATSATAAAGSAVDSATSSPSASATTPSSAAPTPSVPATPTTPAASTAPSASTAPAAPGGSTLTANGVSLLPIPATAAGGDLSQYVGQTATATGVVVQSVPTLNGFWVGTSTTDRVWVQFQQTGLLQPHPVNTGDKVSFTGPIVAHDSGFAASVGCSADDGVDQLTGQKAHISISKSGLTFLS